MVPVHNFEFVGSQLGGILPFYTGGSRHGSNPVVSIKKLIERLHTNHHMDLYVTFALPVNKHKTRVGIKYATY